MVKDISVTQNFFKTGNQTEKDMGRCLSDDLKSIHVYAKIMRQIRHKEVLLKALQLALGVAIV